MVDIDFSNFAFENIDDMSILFMRSGDLSYNTSCTEWPDLICKIQKKTYVLHFTDLYRKIGNKALQKHVTEFIDQNKIDVVYFDTPIDAEFDVRFLENLRKRVFMVMYTDDTALYFNDSFKYYAQGFDLIIPIEYIEKFRFRLYGCKAFSFPTFNNPLEYFRNEISIDDKDIELSFVGRTDRIGRKEYLDFLLNNHIKIDLYGEGTKNGLINTQQKVEIFKRSKFALNFSGCAEYIHNDTVKMIDKRIKQFKGRIMELALSKCLVLTEYAPGLEKSFEIGSEVVVFQDKEDLLEKVQFYQKNPDTARKIALNGYRRVFRDYNPDEINNKLYRLLQLIHTYAKDKTYKPSPIYLDDDFLERMSTRHGVYATRFLKKRDFKLAWEELTIILSGKVRILNLLWAVVREIFRSTIRNSGVLSRIVAKLRGVQALF